MRSADASARMLMLTSAMIRAARGLLGLDQAGAAKLAGLSQRTISKLEAEDYLSSKDLRRRNALKAIRSGFEKAGIEFIFSGREIRSGSSD